MTTHMHDAASVPQLIAGSATDPLNSKRVALEAGGERVAYEALLERIERIAGALLSRRLPRGARVAILGTRSVNTVAALFGVQFAGGAVCVLDPRELGVARAQIAAADVDWLLHERAMSVDAQALGVETTLRIEDMALAPRNCVSDLTRDDDALLLFTSGSTGEPKAVRLSHGNLLANAFGVAERTRVTADDRLLHAMPLHHTNGINNQLIVPFGRGASVVMIDRFRAETFFQAVEAVRPTYITGVPTMYLRLLAHTPPADAMRGLRFARCGSAAITAEQQRQIESHLGIPLVLSYGLSEATCTSTMNPPDAPRAGSVGTALPSQAVAVFVPRTSAHAASGEEGEVCISGPAVMQGYIGARSTDGPCVVDGWLRTGDLGTLDSSGYLTITGRLKDLIIRGGENVSPAAIEAALLAHPEIESCCVVGAPHPELGEMPVAFVVARNPARAPSPLALKDMLRERLSRIHVPRDVIYLGALPENAIGKIDRKALRVLASE